jgi:hypothetical protein
MIFLNQVVNIAIDFRVRGLDFDVDKSGWECFENIIQQWEVSGLAIS